MTENIAAYLPVHARGTPDKPVFIVVEDGEGIQNSVSYAVLAGRVQTTSVFFLERGLRGRRCLLVYRNILEFIVTFLACQDAGVIPVPVPYPRGSKQLSRLRMIVADAGADALLCAGESLGQFSEAAELFLLPGFRIIPTDNAKAEGLAVASSGDELPTAAFLQYTSGSTGNPKGVIVTRSNLAHNQRLIAASFGCDRRSVIFSWLPFHHDMGLIGNILHTVYVGCTCVLMSPFHFIARPRRWLEAIGRFGITHSGGPNFAYDLCVDRIGAGELAGLDLSSWKVAYNGSEPVRAETMQRFSRHFAGAGFASGAFYPCYGLAEATLLVSGGRAPGEPLILAIDKVSAREGKIVPVSEADPDAMRLVSCGLVPAGMEVRIVDSRDNKECRELEEGEICLAGDSVSPGYWNKALPDPWRDLEDCAYTRTGDLGFLYRGELFVHGRLKELLIVRGRNFYPEDIEKLLSEGSAMIEVRGVLVFALEEPAEALVVVAEIKRMALKDPVVVGVIQSIERIMTEEFGFRPYDIVLTTPQAISRTTSGKFRRSQCREDYLSGNLKAIATGGGLREKLQRERDVSLAAGLLRWPDHGIIKKYLGQLIDMAAGQSLSPLPDDRYLTSLGIDSIRIMELVNTVNKELGIQVDVADIFQYNTLAALVTDIENRLWLKNSQTTGKEIII